VYDGSSALRRLKSVAGALLEPPDPLLLQEAPFFDASKTQAGTCTMRPEAPESEDGPWVRSATFRSASSSCVNTWGSLRSAWTADAASWPPRNHGPSYFRFFALGGSGGRFRVAPDLTAWHIRL